MTTPYRAFLAYALITVFASEASAQTTSSGASTGAAAGETKQTATLLPTEELNRRLPAWLRVSGEERLRMEGFDGGGFQSSNEDLYLLQRIRFGLQIHPAQWLTVFAQSQDSRVFLKTQKPYAPPFQDTWDLRQGYAQIGIPDKSIAALRIGRQEINLGDERLVGSTNWSNAARTFDAARLTLHRGKFSVDAFASSVVVLKDGEVGSVQPGNNLHGLYGRVTNPFANTTIEPYILWRLSPPTKMETGGLANQDMKITGLRWIGKLPGGFDYNTEIAIERGSVGTDRIRAWAGHWVVGYTLKNPRYSPRLLVEYNAASGDENTKDGTRSTFDQLYPTAHDKYGLADQVGWKNIRHLRGGIEIKPKPRWMVALRYSSYWLANAHDALYTTSSSAVAIKADGSAGRRVGQELDLVSLLTISKATQIGAGFGHIFPGTFLERATPGHSYSAPYIFFATRF